MLYLTESLPQPNEIDVTIPVTQVKKQGFKEVSISGPQTWKVSVMELKPHFVFKFSALFLIPQYLKSFQL